MSEEGNTEDVIARERRRRARIIAYLKKQGAAEGRDWRWGAAADWDLPDVVDTGPVVEVNERLVPRDPLALPIMISASGVRLLGGPKLATAMDEGLFPAAMPFVIGKFSPESLS